MSRRINTLLTVLLASLCLAGAQLAAPAPGSGEQGGGGARGAVAHRHAGQVQRQGMHARRHARRHRRHRRHTRRGHARRHARHHVKRVRHATHHSHAKPRGLPAAAPPTAPAGPSPAAILATPCAGVELMPTAENLAAIREATLCLVNQERARHGEQPLVPNGDLEEAAQGHSEEMVEEDYFDHVSPDGETPLERIEDCGYIPDTEGGYAIGENIAWATLGLATPQAIVAAWVASPEHLANILDARYRETGIGVDPAAPASLAGDQGGAVYTQEFGVIMG